MNAKSGICPSNQVLADYGLGKLDDGSIETVQRHIETCVDCRQVVAGLPGNGIVDRRREAQPQTGPLRKFAGGESIPGVADNSETQILPTIQPAAPKPRSAPGTPGLANVPPELANHPDYEFLKELGRGGMGVVYLARNRMMDRLEVLKVVSKSLLDRPGALERFQQEIRSAAKLAHSNIVAAYSVLRPGDLLVFAMEYVNGQDLAQVVKQRGPLPITNATFYIQQVALGLQHAHEKGMVHRDIKPNNLMLAIVNKKHVVKILDFGLAKATSEKGDDGGLTKSGQMMGTPDYIAPEQSLDAQKADIRADIYSLGCTLYYLLAGHKPFQGNSLFETLQAHHQTEARPLNLERPEVPAELAGVVAKMMAKDPANRFQTPMEVAKALNPFFKAGAAAGQSGINRNLPPSADASPSIAPVEALPMAAVPVAPTPLAMATPVPLPFAQPVFQVATPVYANPLATLTDFGATTTPRKKTAKKRRRPLALPVAVGLLLVGVVAFGAMMFKFRTADGVVAIEVNEPNPEIFVDGNQATVTWDSGGTKAEITLPAGTRKIELKKDGFKAVGETVELESRGRRVLVARLEQLAPGNRTDNGELARRTVTEPEPITTAAASAGATTAAPVSAPPPAVSTATADGSASFFNRHDLAGWTGLPAYWQVRDGAIVGAPAAGVTAHTFLYSQKTYKDFELRFKVLRKNGVGRSGVQIRSQVAAAASCTQTGPKIEIDDSASVAYAPGSVLNEPNAVPAYAANQNVVSSVWKDNEFNEMYIKCVDKIVQVAINGLRVLSVEYPQMPAEGHIAWHLNGTRPPEEITFKDIEFADFSRGDRVLPTRVVTAIARPALPAGAPPPVKAIDGFVSLFNGRDLTGWKTDPGQRGHWQVTNGVLIGSGPASHLFSNRDDFKDIHLRVEARINAGGNSGVYFRTQFGPAFPAGYEAQINSTHRDPNKTGSLYIRGGQTIGVAQSPVPPNQWFLLEVIASGNHIVIKVNGKTVTDYTDDVSRFTIGHIALQQHNPETVVEFRKIEIKELSTAKAVGSANSKPDRIADRLAKAKTTYQDNLEKLKDGLLKNLDKQEATARATGDKKLLAQIAREREALQARGEIPAAMPTVDYQRQLSGARAQLEAAYDAAIRGLTKAKLDGAADAAARELAAFQESAPVAVEEFGGKRYKLFGDRLTWHQAQSRCLEMGGHLPIVLTPAENDFLAALVKSAGIEGSWLGSTDEKIEGQWRWVNDAPLEYANWVRGQPNNAAGIEHYAVLLISAQGKWWDYPDDPPAHKGLTHGGTPGFVCQWD